MTVSIQPASGPAAPVGHGPRQPESVAPPSSADPAEQVDVALEFVRFCYRRRRVSWPALYDELSAVAARGMFRGMGYGELAEHGVSFCLGDLPRMVALTERVIGEEDASAEPRAAMATLSLVAAST